MKCLVDNLPEERKRMLAFIVKEHPETTVRTFLYVYVYCCCFFMKFINQGVLNKCSALVEDRDLSRLGIIFDSETERQREEGERLRAALVFQANWRAVLGRRKFLVLRRGFIILQRLYR